MRWRDSPTSVLWHQLEGGFNPLSFTRPSTLKYKCRPTVTSTITATVTIIVTISVTSTYNLSTCHYIQPITVSNLSHQPFTIIDTQPDPLTWIIYQGHLSTRCPTSPTHSSTKHVPRSPTYHHKVCVTTMYQIMYQTINLYHTKNQLCTTTCATTSASTMHQHLYQIVHQS
jgi:hypothetical protein